MPRKRIRAPWRRSARPCLPVLLILGFLLMAGRVAAEGREVFRPGALSATEWDGVLADACRLPGPGTRVAMISTRFLQVPYRAGTLIGSDTVPEVLVADLGAVDCFTFLDYVEALRRARTFGEFRDRLVRVRYREGVVAYSHRRHFFTDWAQVPDGRIEDITERLGKARTRSLSKDLNAGEKGGVLLPGLPIQKRVVHYLATADLDDEMVSGLQTGDYAGIYSERAGLDVSHVGIIIRKGEKIYLRHASSRPETGRVVDNELLPYLAGKPGLVVLRPR